MTHRGPFQPLLFCDSVILWFQFTNVFQVMKHFLKHTDARKSVHGSDFMLFSERCLNGKSFIKPI